MLTVRVEIDGLDVGISSTIACSYETWFSSHYDSAFFVHTWDHGVGVVHHVDITAGREEEAVVPGLVISESKY